jgi:choline-sulfatase
VVEEGANVSDRPNILLLFSDQHASRVTGCYGDPVVRTPHLDSLASGGVTFANAYCPSPICLPSRMSFLTGREPVHQACWTNHDILPSGIPTYAHALGAAGYDATLVGRLHSIGPDQQRGFRARFVGDHSTNWIGGKGHDLGPLDKANDPWRESLTASGPGGSAYERHDDDVTDAAVDYLHELGRGRASGDTTPFALTVGWLLPHAPYVCSPELYAHYEGRIPPPAIPVPNDEHPHYRWWRTNRGVSDATDAEIERARTAYYGLVSALDAMVGRVLHALEESGLAENTLVVYISDHGEHIGERGLWWKSTLYDEAAKVPMIISWMDRIQGGRREDAVVGLTDLTATMLDAAGAPALPNSQGRSFLPLLLDPDAPWRDEVVSEYVNDGVPAWSGGRMVISRMLRRDRYKLIWHRGHPEQFFDLENDPMERNDLAGDPALRGVRDAMRERLLSDWDPEEIATTLEARKAEHLLLAEWAAQVEPPDLIRWPMKPEDNWLAERTTTG